jgi:predicted AAA+ superfamily ATPase
MIQRILTKQIRRSLQAKKSILLLGPRQVGKSTLARELAPDCELNLASESVFLEFARAPSFLEETLKARLPKGGLVFLDEVQRVPSLLNTVQYLIDGKKGYQFILTGSSARKLKRGKANLLPGRVHSYELGPLACGEAGAKLSSQDALAFGMLPGVFTEREARNRKMLLRSYATTYLSEEIKAEALTKNIEGFTRFLFRLSADATRFLDLSKISNAAAVPRQTTQRYFEILEDTLLVKRLDSFAKSDKRRLTQHPRFFFFDNGVLNGLLRNFAVSEDRKGVLFENLFFTQLLSALSYSDHDYRVSSYRTDAGAEVDVILEINGEIHAIEIKSGDFRKSDLGGFASFEGFIGKKVRKTVVTLASAPRNLGEIEARPWADFLGSVAAR